MALERLVIGLHVPPFLVDCDDAFCVTLEVATSQIQNTGATIFVCKDLADDKNRKVQSPQVSAHRLALWQVQRSRREKVPWRLASWLKAAVRLDFRR